MQDHAPVARADRPALPVFDPVPRQYRHDGWTPERQRAFIEALADCGSVTRAASMVNMAQANCYTLRRAPGAEGFRRAWDAALDFGLARLKDIAFERAIEGYLVPVFVGGKLMGYRRKTNDALLMFCLRHYGQDRAGRRTTIDYFTTRAEAGAGAGAASGADSRGGAVAQASTTTVRTVISGGGGAGGGGGAEGGSNGGVAAEQLAAFEGVPLDAPAMAAISAALEACAERRRAADAVIDRGGDAATIQELDDPKTPFVRVAGELYGYDAVLDPGGAQEDFVPFTDGEAPWELAGLERP